jgi:F0F1-type ATP synthase membrane subunit b/b'
MGQGRTNGLFGTNGRVADARAAEAKRAVQAVTVETRDQLGKRIDQAQADIDLAVKDAQQQASEAADSARSKWAQM